MELMHVIKINFTDKVFNIKAVFLKYIAFYHNKQSERTFLNI